MADKNLKDLNTRIQQIRLVAMDVDGVLTEGRLMYTADQQEICCFNIKDGMGLTMARHAGLKIVIISGRESEVVARRAKDLQFSAVYQGVINKLGPFLQLQSKYNLTKRTTLISIIRFTIIKRPIIRNGLTTAAVNLLKLESFFPFATKKVS